MNVIAVSNRRVDPARKGGRGGGTNDLGDPRAGGQDITFFGFLDRRFQYAETSNGNVFRELGLFAGIASVLVVALYGAALAARHAVSSIILHTWLEAALQLSALVVALIGGCLQGGRRYR